MSLPPSDEIPEGAIRFNTDSQKLEFYAQGEWWMMSTDTPNLAKGSAGSDRQPGARGLFAGGSPTTSDVIQYLNFSSTGDTSDFGDLLSANNGGGGSGGGSSTRGIFFSGSDKFHIDFITFATTGNSQNFGNSLDARTYSAAFSNSTRGIQGGGTSSSTPTGNASDIIEYITMAATGNAVDFGDLTTKSLRFNGVASPTRGIFLGGRESAPGDEINVMQFITIATLGDTQDFGDLSRLVSTGGAASNAIRGLYFGGRNSVKYSEIDYITIASAGNSVSFGDLTFNAFNGAALSSPTRAVYALGTAETPSSTDVNTIEYVNIATQGDAVDFGDLLNTNARSMFPTSNAHGGL